MTTAKEICEMKIEVKGIRYLPSMSQETNCYEATVWVDGQKAFAVGNAGHGGCDDQHKLPGYTGPSLTEVDAWLKANMAPDTSHGITLEYDLELFCGVAVDAHIEALERKRIEGAFNRVLTKQLAAITPDGRFVTFNKKHAPTPANIDSLRKAKPDYTIVNGADDATRQRAFALYCPDLAQVAA